MKIIYLVLLASTLQSCSTLPPEVTATWVGTYEVLDKTTVASSNSPVGVSLATEEAGRATRVTELKEGTKIIAKVGYGFGVIYRVPAEFQDGLKAVVHMPAPGIPDQRNGGFQLQDDWKPGCSEDKCRSMYNFDHESELVPGIWRVELWRHGTRLQSHEFTLTR
jgi:hypothetical protein